jgi:heme-degrading monooxygenase HmoA
MQMYARVARFAGVTSEHAETLKRLGKEQFLPQMQQMEGYAGTLMLHDTDAGQGVDVEFFDSREAMEAAHRELDAMTPPDELAGINRVSVTKYEVLHHEISGDPAVARISLLEGPPDGIDEGFRKAKEDVLPRARQVDGFQGLIYLADRESGKTRVVTFWESDEARQASEEEANKLRQQAADAGGETITGVDRADVIALTITAGART